MVRSCVHKGGDEFQHLRLSHIQLAKVEVHRSIAQGRSAHAVTLKVDGAIIDQNLAEAHHLVAYKVVLLLHVACCGFTGVLRKRENDICTDHQLISLHAYATT